MTQHIHAKEMMQYAEDATNTDKPWELWECRHIDIGGGWKIMSSHPIWGCRTEYRRKPEYIDINGFKVPKPVTAPLEFEQEYYVSTLTPNFFYSILASSYTWSESTKDYQRLKSGLIHLTKEAAETHSKALLSFTKDL